MPKNFSYYLLTASLFIFGLSVGFFIGKNYFQKTLPSNENLPQSVTTTRNNLYTSQTATIRGKITKVEGTSLTVENLTTKATGVIQTTDNIVINKAGSKPSSQLSSLELDKEVLIGLELINGNFSATSIQYPLAAPSLRPLPQASKT
jgi:hypothetical protein